MQSALERDPAVGGNGERLSEATKRKPSSAPVTDGSPRLLRVEWKGKGIGR